MSKLHTPEVERLVKAVLKLETEEECFSFFEDICTIKEIQDMSQRLQVAEMLNQNKSYTEISKETGASTATISRVNKCLNYGSDGYRRVLDKLEEKEQTE
ncbi:MAG: TrpR-like protein YerC/YecD [Clostridia bacterium]|nr:TrpR-like protein YerC/YecD [Oscillospiraceae bacterium]MBQ7960838.1 TrpR-like protein YerC/YecD [Clostridia bacterium]